MPGPVTFGKYYYATMILTVICLACAITSLIISTHADVYIKTDIVGTGSGSSYHEGRLSESSGFRNASTEYHYEGMRTAETTTQVSEFMMAGGDGSYWNYHRTWTEKDIAGKNELKISVGKIEGSYYGKNGMNISYNAAGTEEFTSTLTIDAENASIELRVVNWKTGKPATLEEIDRTGQFVVDQIVKLTEPLDEPSDWLQFCAELDKDINMPEGIYVLPANTSQYNYTLKGDKIVRSLNTSNV